MRISGSMILLLFGNDEVRSETLQKSDLSRWFSRVELWAPEFEVENRWAWLEVGRILIETKLQPQFNDIVEVEVPGCVYSVRVVETDWPVMFECQCVYGDVYESHSSSEEGESSFSEPIEVIHNFDNNANHFVQKGVDDEKQSSVETMVLKLHTPMARDTGTYRSKDCSVETCVPDSFGMLDKVDGLVSWSAETFVDQGVVGYVNEVESMLVQHVKSSMSDIMLQLLTSGERAVAEKQLANKGRGKSRENNPKELDIANCSLSDSDFLNKKRVILCKAKETLEFGKLIGAKTIGREKDIVKDLCHLGMILELSPSSWPSPSAPPLSSPCHRLSSEFRAITTIMEGLENHRS
ncbi:hypothetical protein V6N13_059763 [Hibiscus sabdariffa]